MPRKFSDLAKLGMSQEVWELENGDFARYVSDGRQGLFLCYDRHEKYLKGYHCATAEEYQELDRQTDPGAGDYFSEPSFEAVGSFSPRALAKADEKDPEAGDEKDDETNAVQTEREAQVAQDQSLIDRIQNIFQTDSCKEILEQKIDFSHLTTLPKFDEDLKPIGKEPLVQTTFVCVFGNFIPEMVIFEPEELVILSRRNINVTQAKKFMFQRIQESSKFSVGLGLPLLSGSGISTDGPEVGEPAFENGEPKVDGAGVGLSFNFSMVKEYAELTIKASMDIAFNVEGYEIQRVPRKKSSAAAALAASAI